MENSSSNSSFVGPEDICHYCYKPTRHSALSYNYTDHQRERFISFVRNQLVPILKPYDGRSPNSIVIMGKFVELDGFFLHILGDDSLNVKFPLSFGR